MIVLKNLDGVEQAASEFLKQMGGNKVFAFVGDMGAGKTTFIKEICKGLGVMDDITSPTFAIVNEYKSNTLDQIIFHFDFYRINSIEEAFDMGYEDYFYSGSYCFIEWPEKIETLLPTQFTKVSINVQEDNSRLIEIENITN